MVISDDKKYILEHPSLNYTQAQVQAAEEALAEEESEEKKYKKVRPGAEAAVAYLANEEENLTPEVIQKKVQLNPRPQNVKAIQTEFEDNFKGNLKNDAVSLLPPSSSQNKNGIQQALQLPGDKGPNVLLQVKGKNFVGPLSNVLKFVGNKVKEKKEELEKKSQSVSLSNLKKGAEVIKETLLNKLNPLKTKPKPPSGK